MRLRAAKFADAHLTPTAAAAEPHDVTPALVEDALRRSLTTATHVTAAGSPSPRMAAAIERIAAVEHPQAAAVPARWFPPLRAALAFVLAATGIAACVSRGRFVELFESNTTAIQRQAMADAAPWFFIGVIYVAVRTLRRLPAPRYASDRMWRAAGRGRPGS